MSESISWIHSLLNTDTVQETLNYWKQLAHLMKYFRPEEDPSARLPKNFMSGFLQVCRISVGWSIAKFTRAAIDFSVLLLFGASRLNMYMSIKNKLSHSPRGVACKFDSYVVYHV